MWHMGVPCRFSSTDVAESSRTIDKTQSPCHHVSWQPHREMPTILCRPWLTAKAEGSSAPSSRPSSLALTPSSRILEQHMTQAAYSPPVESGLMGSKEVEVLGRTELLSSEAEDCSSCVSNAAGWPSKSPLPLDSAAGTSHSGTATDTPRNVISHQPQGSCCTDSALAGSAGQAAAQGDAFLLSSRSILRQISC